jgi:hypothetical protein
MYKGLMLPPLHHGYIRSGIACCTILELTAALYILYMNVENVAMVDKV